MTFDVSCAMRIAVMILCGLVVMGCASRKVSTTQPQAQVVPQSLDDSATAAALVFDPPVTAGEAPIDLSRAGREPSAFVSYDQTFTTFYYLNFQDRQFLTRDRSSFRTSYTQTIGVSSR